MTVFSKAFRDIWSTWVAGVFFEARKLLMVDLKDFIELFLGLDHREYDFEYSKIQSTLYHISGELWYCDGEHVALEGISKHAAWA